MLEVAKTFLSETNKQNFQPSFDEISNKKFSPKELLENSESKGISGGKTEVNEIEQESKKIKTINNDLEGEKHPVTSVPYERDILPDGSEGVFPVFPAIAEVQLPEDLYQETDRGQFKACNEDLKKQTEDNPELKSKFDEEQLAQIENGRTPSGYTWHHHQQDGKMQLVPTDIHDKSAHTGGKALWGGGQENRQ